MKKNPIKPIIKVHLNQELDTDEGESTKDEGESTTSTELSEENSTSDTPAETKEDSKPIETSEAHTVFNKSVQDKDDSSEDKFVTDIEPTKENGSKILYKRTNSYLPTLQLKLKTEKLKGSYPINGNKESQETSNCDKLTKSELWGVYVLNHISRNGQFMELYNKWVSILQQRIHVLW